MYYKISSFFLPKLYEGLLRIWLIVHYLFFRKFRGKTQAFCGRKFAFFHSLAAFLASCLPMPPPSPDLSTVMPWCSRPSHSLPRMESQSQTKVDPRKQALLEARFFGGGRAEDFEVEKEPGTPPVVPMSLATSFPANCQPPIQSPMLVQPLPTKPSTLPLGKIFQNV